MPIIRPAHIKTPCSACAKVPQSVKDSVHPLAINKAHAINLSPQNTAVLEHYLTCKAVGVFPDDPIVRRHARILREMEDRRDRDDLFFRFDQVLSVLGVMRRS